MTGRIGEFEAVHAVVAGVFGDDGAFASADHEVRSAEFAKAILVADLHELELEAVDGVRLKLAFRNQSERLGIFRIAALGEVEDASVADLPGFVFRRKTFGRFVTVFRNHLARKKVDIVTEIAIFLIVEEEDTAHSDAREVAKTEVGNPEVRVRTKRIAQGVIHLFEHFIIGFERLFLLENAVLIKITVVVFHCAHFLFVSVIGMVVVLHRTCARLRLRKTENANARDPADQRF